MYYYSIDDNRPWDPGVERFRFRVRGNGCQRLISWIVSQEDSAGPVVPKGRCGVREAK